MQIEELNLDVRTYNQIKRTGVSTAEELLDKLYLPDSVRDFPTRTRLHIEQALKAAGAVKYVRGDYITADDVEPVPLSWDALHGMCGKLIARDISTESQQAFRVCWVYQFSSDDSRMIFQYNGNNYANSADDGKFYALRTEEPEMIVTEQRTPPADASLAVTEQYTEAYNLNVKIHTSMQAIQQNLYDMCSALKKMRDGKLYKELGYQNFEEYCENEAGIKRAHAYRFINIIEKLPADFVSSMRQIGATKLTLLTALTDDQREELTQTVDLESTTVRELKEQIAALKEEAELDRKERDNANDAAQRWKNTAQSAQADNQRLENQVQSLTDQVKEAEEAKERNRLTLRGIIDKKVELVHQLEAQIKELESKPQDVAVVDRTEEVNELKTEIESLRQQLSEKPDTQLALGVEPIFQTDSKALFKPYLTAAADAVNRLAEFIGQHQSDANYDFFMEKMHAAFAFADQKIQAMKG